MVSRTWAKSIDHFVAEALAHNLDFELINYPGGHHGFDIFDDTERSRAIIRRTLDFMREHLQSDRVKG
jgi:dipeptidyl aminopeptidase/acylaminoacyl peptidase